MSNQNGASREHLVRETAKLLASQEGAETTPGRLDEDSRTVALLLDALAPEKEALRPLGRAMRARILQQLGGEEMLPARSALRTLAYSLSAVAAVFVISVSAWFMTGQAAPAPLQSAHGIQSGEVAHTLAVMVASSAPGESLQLKSGSFSETLTISKPVRLQANGGPVRLGAT